MLRKTATNDRDFDWAFGLNRLSLQMMGLWPEELGKESSSNRLKILRIPLMIIWLVVGLLLPQIYALSKIYRQLTLVVDNLIASGAAVASSVKLFFLWNNRHVIESLIHSLIQDYGEEKSRQDHELMINYAGYARIFTMSGYAIMFACFIGFIASPLYGGIRIVNNITDHLDGRFLPLQTYYPYDFERSPYFQLTYLTQAIASSIIGISFSVPDNFFGALVLHSSAISEILCRKFNQLIPIELAQVQRDSLYFRIQLGQVVRRHVRLICFVSDIENSFNALILAQVLCLSLVICCLGFTLITSLGNESESAPLVQVVTLVGTTVNLMSHMLIYCIAAEILSNKSTEFSNAVYNLKWYYLSYNNSRDIMLVIIRSHNPLRLTAGKFLDLSLNTYLKIVKSMASYVSMLLAMNN